MPTNTHTSHEKKRTRNKRIWYTLFVLNLCFIIWIWWSGSSHYYIANPGSGNIFVALGRLVGLLLQFTLIIQVLLISRIAAIEQAFGFDKLNNIHRLIGEWLIVLLVLHPFLLVVGNAQANSVGLLNQFGAFLATWEDVWNAFLGASIFIYIATLSYAFIRKKVRYELWYFLHLLVYAALILAFLHQTNTGDLVSGLDLYYWNVINCGTLVFVALYRFVRPIVNALRFEFRVDRVVHETHDTYSVYITGKNIRQFHYKAGQYANITFLQRRLWFTHPFSFSAEPNAQYIRFTMKALGDHTRRLGELKHGTRVILDGPLGLFVEDAAFRTKFLLIAGGIGITPIRALVSDLVSRKRDFVLLYAARTIRDIAFRTEFDEIMAAHPFPLHYILNEPLEGYESGLIDREKITRLVPDFYERDVYLCGPPPMMKATVKNLLALGVEQKHIHFEKFSF